MNSVIATEIADMKSRQTKIPSRVAFDAITHDSRLWNVLAELH